MVSVVGSACTTSSGAYDDLNVLADFAEEHGLWFHVDGAHGAPAVFSQRHAHLVSGLGRAHSVAMDFHGHGCAGDTGLFYGRYDHSFLPFTQAAEYLWSDAEEPEWWNFGKRTFECTKRMLSTRVRLFSRNMVLVDRLFDLGRELADQVEQRPDFELAMRPEAVVCFRHPSIIDQRTGGEGQPPCGRRAEGVIGRRPPLRRDDPIQWRGVAEVRLDESTDRASGLEGDVGPGGAGDQAARKSRAGCRGHPPCRTF